MQILFLSGWCPYPADNGSKIRVHNLLRALARCHELTLITFNDTGREVDQEALKSYGHIAGVIRRPVFQRNRAKALIAFLNRLPRSVVDTYSADMAQAVSQALSRDQYDAVVASQLLTAFYLADAYGLPKIFEEMETGIIREAYTRATNRRARLRAGLTWAKQKRYVGWLMQRFDACTVVSDLELHIAREIAPTYDRVSVIPNGVDVEALQPTMAEPQPNMLVFNGALTFGANLDAMRYFLKDIWPAIKRTAPDAALKITGRTEGVNLQGLPLSDGASLTGYLPDIRPTVAGAWACVVPLRIGGGTRLKILEAMALGTPVISTRKGAEGLAVTPEVDILLVDSPAEFAAQTVRLLGDGELRRRLAENGRRLVETQYSWRSIGQQFNRLIESVVNSRRGH